MVDFRIFPTENDVGNATGEGQWATEENLIRVTAAASGSDAPQSFILDGHNFGLEPLGLGTQTLTVDPGSAMISGYHVELVNQLSVDVGNFGIGDHWHWLELIKVGGLVTGAQLVRQKDDPTPPADSVFICKHNVTGTPPNRTITNLRDGRMGSANRRQFGEYAGDGTNGRVISLPFTPRYVRVTTTGLVSESGTPLIPFSSGAASDSDALGDKGAARLSVDRDRWDAEIDPAGQNLRLRPGFWTHTETGVTFSGSVPAGGVLGFNFTLSEAPPSSSNSTYKQGLISIPDLRRDMGIVEGPNIVTTDSGVTWVCELVIRNFDSASHDTEVSGSNAHLIIFSGGGFATWDAYTYSASGAASLNAQYVPSLNVGGNFVVSFDSVDANDNVSLNRSGFTYRYYAEG